MTNDGNLNFSNACRYPAKFKAERNICQRENLHIRLGPIESTHCSMIHNCLRIKLETFVQLPHVRVFEQRSFFHIVIPQVSYLARGEGGEVS